MQMYTPKQTVSVLWKGKKEMRRTVSKHLITLWQKFEFYKYRPQRYFERAHVCDIQRASVLAYQWKWRDFTVGCMCACFADETQGEWEFITGLKGY